jgi:hypothetical protein
MKRCAGLSYRLRGARACLTLWSALSGACLLEPGSLDDGAQVEETGSSALADPTCSTGIPNGDVCCSASCGSCGGSGCGSRPGGASACCAGPITTANVSCSGSEPPCVIQRSAGDPTCATGIAAGTACCASSCGACGGTGCASRPGGAEACCANPINSSGVSCSGSMPPCTMGSGGGGGGGPRWELLRADFQGQSVGTYSQGKVASDFGSAASWSNGLNQGRAKIVQEGSNRFLRVTYPANQFGPGNGGVQFEVGLHGKHEELYLSYRVRFAPGFDFVQGGKLPGLVGGTAPTGCTTDRTGGFSARSMWRPSGSLAQYLYHPERQNRCGDDWYYKLNGSNFRFTPGQWHTIEHHIRMGTRGQQDGVMQGYIDGRLALDGRIKWRNSGANYGIDKLFFSTFFGGSSQSWAPRSQQQADFDDFVVADKPITH